MTVPELLAKLVLGNKLETVEEVQLLEELIIDVRKAIQRTDIDNKIFENPELGEMLINSLYLNMLYLKNQIEYFKEKVQTAKQANL